jgi:hypothetical protein
MYQWAILTALCSMKPGQIFVDHSLRILLLVVLFCFVLFSAYVGLPELDTRLTSDECPPHTIILLHFILMTIGY